MPLIEDVERVRQEARERIGNAGSLALLEQLRVEYLGRKGAVTAFLRGLKELDPEERKQVGAAANRCRGEIEQYLAEALTRLSAKAKPVRRFDPTLPGTAQRVGAVHIVNQVLKEICDIFYGMGFEIAKGPDVESDYYNFEALNFPPDHPARDEHDTFYVEGGRLLRTHTTPVQARELERCEPPVKIIVPGKCFRNEAVSTRAHVVFHQVDGFLADEGVSLADLKGALWAFCQAFFGKGVKMKFRPNFFPFTEPSAEVDISCFLCGEKGCRLCKHTGWLEVLGCGMIDPAVFEKAGWDSEKYTGYAFGMGVERIAMLRYRIDDIRAFFNNDIRFLRQFK